MVDIKKLKELRKETGVSLSLCKKALEESKDNIAAAKKLLTSWGAETISKKQGRETSHGAIFSYVHHNRKVASMVELLSETDFVSGNAEFHKLGQELAMQVASLPAKDNAELLKEEYVRDPSKKIEDLIHDAVLKFGEHIKIGKFIRWTL